MNALTLSDEVEIIVYNVYMRALEASPEKNALFREMMMVGLNGTTRLLMIVGAINQYYPADDSCVAVLNPDKSLLREIHPGWYYGSSALTLMVQGKCDFALGLIINTCGGFRADPYFEYTSQPAAHPRFTYLGYRDTETLIMP